MDPQWLLLLSLLLWSHSEAEVVESVSDCAEFFLNKNPPEIPGVLVNGQILDQNRYKAICQTYENQRRFFTLYDTTKKIPVFSAYIFKGGQMGTLSTGGWMTEPQLEENMEQPCDENEEYENQASDNDYKNNWGYDRGLFYPSSYGYSLTDTFSTFTLTNAVPQAGAFKRSWNRMESCVECVMRKYCLGITNQIKGFLVTGAEPGNNLLNNKVNIPSKMWSAFCCYSSEKNKWLSSAHWSNNVPDIHSDKYMETKTLNELYYEFSNNSDFKLFSGNQCPSDGTVIEFYPELNAKNEHCNCPPTSTTTAQPTTQKPTSTTRTTTTTTTTTTKASKKTPSLEEKKKQSQKNNQNEPNPDTVKSGNGLRRALIGTGIVGGLSAAIASIGTGVVSGSSAAIASVGTGVVSGSSGAIASVGTGVVSGSSGAIASVGTGVVSGSSGAIASVGTGVVSGSSGAIASAGGIVGGSSGAIASVGTGVVSGSSGAIASVGTGVVSGLSGAIASVGTGIVTTAPSKTITATTTKTTVQETTQTPTEKKKAPTSALQTTARTTAKLTTITSTAMTTTPTTFIATALPITVKATIPNYTYPPVSNGNPSEAQTLPLNVTTSEDQTLPPNVTTNEAKTSPPNITSNEAQTVEEEEDYLYKAFHRHGTLYMSQFYIHSVLGGGKSVSPGGD